MALEKLVRVLFFVSLGLLLAALWKSESLPEVREINEALLAEPEQQPYKAAAFDTRVGGIDYRIQPRFTYELHGLIVSRHDSDTWWDYIHKEMNDKINVVDLCVVWGENIRRDAYRAIDYTHDQWTCWYQTGSSEAWHAFDQKAISNNHMITDSAAMAKSLRKARIGDQIVARGYLADYTTFHPDNRQSTRVSSSTRDDTGNGACEVLYVEDFQILKPGGGIWRKMRWIASALLVLSLFAWFTLPARANN